jgi:hypothetical protein
MSPSRYILKTIRWDRAWERSSIHVTVTVFRWRMLWCSTVTVFRWRMLWTCGDHLQGMSFHDGPYPVCDILVRFVNEHIETNFKVVAIDMRVASSQYSPEVKDGCESLRSCGSWIYLCSCSYVTYCNGMNYFYGCNYEYTEINSRWLQKPMSLIYRRFPELIKSPGGEITQFRTLAALRVVCKYSYIADKVNLIYVSDLVVYLLSGCLWGHVARTAAIYKLVWQIVSLMLYVAKLI